MARKVFLSFLGTGFYKPTFYIAEGQEPSEVRATRFAQEAVITTYAKDFELHDRIYIFTTNGALANWEDNYHTDPATKEPVYYEGLKTCLGRCDLKTQPKNIPVPDGRDQMELWKIFDDAFHLLNNGDELIVDITHGYRTLPLFFLTLLSYSKALKNVSVRGIYYGNYEARDKINGVDFSPIWDLKALDQLNEWSQTANIFLQTGNALPLANLMSIEDVQLKDNLSEYSKSIMVNRGKFHLDGTNILSLRNNLRDFAEKNDLASSTPLKHVLESVRHEFDGFKENSPINSFRIAKWAFEKNMLAQAATLLEEGILTFVLYDIEQPDAVLDSGKRSTVSGAFNVQTVDQFDFSKPKPLPASPKARHTKENDKQKAHYEWQTTQVPIILARPYKEELGNILYKTKELRNDINHAGFRKNDKSFDQLQVEFVKIYNRLCNLSIFDLHQLPIIRF